MTTIDATDSPVADEPQKLTPGTLFAASLAVCVAQVALASPAVLNGLFQQDLGTSSSQLTWISDAFLVPVALLELTFGALGDLFGRKRLLFYGTLLLAVGQSIGMLTPGSDSSTSTRVMVLWSGQILAGLGAAAIFPTTLAMVAAGTHTIHDRSRAISIWAAALATGGMISPVMGGFLARFSFGDDAFASWRWSFAAVTVLALISALVTLGCAANSSAPAGRSLDWPGQITIAIALFALLYAVIQGPTSGWNSGSVNLAFATATAFLVLFVMAEFHSETPLLRLDLFSSRAFSASALVTVFGMFAYLGSGYTTSIRLAAIQGFTPLKTSIAFVMLNGMAWFTVPLVSRSLERYNPRWTLGLGFGLVGVGNLWLATESASTMSTAPIVAPLMLSGIGFAFAFSAVTAVAVNTAPKHLAGMASGATSLLRDFGFTLGPAIIGSIALSRAATEISEKVSSNATLARAVESFNDSAANAPVGQKAALEAAIGAVNSGPLGANAVPGSITVADGTTVPFNPLKDVAFHALDHAYSLGYAICAVAALIAALLAAAMLSGNPNELLIAESAKAEKRRPHLARR